MADRIILADAGEEDGTRTARRERPGRRRGRRAINQERGTRTGLVWGYHPSTVSVISNASWIQGGSPHSAKGGCPRRAEEQRTGRTCRGGPTSSTFNVERSTCPTPSSPSPACVTARALDVTARDSPGHVGVASSACSRLCPSPSPSDEVRDLLHPLLPPPLPRRPRYCRLL